jgi:hypothetical protein
MRMKARVLLIAAMMAILTVSCAHALVIDDTKLKPLQERQLMLRLSMVKTNYLELEPIFITFWVENIGDKTEYFRPPEIRELAIRDQSDTLMHYRGPMVDYVTQALKTDTGYIQAYLDWMEVPPHSSSLRFVMCVLDYYGLGNRWSDFRLPAGTYRITGKGIKSDTLFLQIVNPVNRADIDAEELLEQALSISGGERTDQRYSAFQEFLARYPRSAYASVALRRAFLVSDYVSTVAPGNAMALGLRLLTEYPNSGFVWEVLATLDPDKVTADQQTIVGEKLRAVRAAFPGTQYELRAQSLLKKIKK